MKKIFALCLLLVSIASADIYTCVYFSDTQKNTDIVEYKYDQKFVVSFNQTGNELLFGFGNHLAKFTKFDAGNDPRLKNIDTYGNKVGNVIGVYDNFENGVRLSTYSSVMDFVDCKKSN